MNIVYSNPLGSDGGVLAAGGGSFREFVTATGPSLGYVRFLLKAGTAGVTTDRASISVQGAATQPNVQLLPTQIFFNGGSTGLVLSSNQQTFSDWSQFSFAKGDILCGSFDAQAGSQAQLGAPTGADRIWLAGPEQFAYNQTTVTGFVDNGNFAIFISQVQTTGLTAVVNSQWNDSWKKTTITAY